MICPHCVQEIGNDENPLADLVLGIDDHGIYMEHPACGHRGREGDGIRIDTGVGLTHEGCRHD